MTLYEYFQTPETVVPQELIYGHVRVADSPSPVHQHAVGAFFLTLHGYLATRGIGKAWLAPLDVILDADAQNRGGQRARGMVPRARRP